MTTWWEAAHRCTEFGGILATFGTLATADVNFAKADLIHRDCAWIGLVKKFFYWTVILRKYSLLTARNLITVTV